MSRYASVVFDLDGTLIDSFRAVTGSLNAARSAFGLPPLSNETVIARVGEPLEQIVQELVDQDVERAVELFREAYAERFLAESQPIRHAPEAVRELAGSGLRLAVASNKPSRFGRPLLEAAGLAPPIELVLGPDAQTPPKPEPAMLRLAMERLESPPGRTLYVGDVPLDVVTAERAGVDVALVATGAAGAAALADHGAPVFANLRGLSDWVRGRSPELTAGHK